VVMLQALEEFFPSEVTWTKPKGGLFLWVKLPEGMDCHELFDAALKENVAFVPGDCFYAANGHQEEGLRHFRLNFSNAQPEQIREGIRRLGVAIKKQLAVLHPVTSVR
jgi:2-aminoadipate transaminase